MESTATPSYSLEDVMKQAQSIYPKATAGWLQALVTIIEDFGPAFLALFMAKTPPKASNPSDPDHLLLANLAACVDLSGPRVVKGPILDPFAKAIADKAKALILDSAPAALDFAESAVLHFISGITS